MTMTMLTANEKTSDGGYYALKGFEYQIDKTILMLLETANENDEIQIEQIQDINSDNFVMQVKYKEASKYAPSKISKPLIQLMDEFSNHLSSNPLRIYYLYCHFLDKEEKSEQITLGHLDLILGSSKDKFTVDIKNLFLDNFFLVFSSTFQDQFNTVITKVSDLFGCNDNAEVIFYYANIADQIRKIIILNPKKENRVCTRKQVVNAVRNGKRLVFNSAFKEFKGDKAYLQYIKSKFVKPKQNQENYIFLGSLKEEDAYPTGQLVIEIINRYYKNVLYDFKLSSIDRAV